jgi:hypothetical protein
VLRVLADASHEPELADLLEETRRERLTGTRQLLSTLSGRTADDERLGHATDVVWALISPELALLLVEHRGWTHAAYGDWLGEQLIDQLCTDCPRAPERGAPQRKIEALNPRSPQWWSLCGPHATRRCDGRRSSIRLL